MTQVRAHIARVSLCSELWAVVPMEFRRPALLDRLDSMPHLDDAAAWRGLQQSVARVRQSLSRHHLGKTLGQGAESAAIVRLVIEDAQARGFTHAGKNVRQESQQELAAYSSNRSSTSSCCASARSASISTLSAPLGYFRAAPVFTSNHDASAASPQAIACVCIPQSGCVLRGVLFIELLPNHLHLPHRYSSSVT